MFIHTGRPQPDVRWLINGQLVDDQFEQNFGNVIENRLLSPSIKRSDLHSIFTCQAVNTHLMEPKEKNYVLDMYCKFFHISIPYFYYHIIIFFNIIL